MAKLVEDAKEQFNGLSDREQKLVLLTGSVLILFVLIVSYWWTEGAITKRKKNISIKQEELQLVESKRTAYNAALKAEDAAKMRLKKNSVSLFSKIQDAAKQQGLELRDLNDSKVPVKSRTRSPVRRRVFCARPGS